MSTQYDQTTTAADTTDLSLEDRHPEASAAPTTPSGERGWRHRLLRGRTAVAAGIVAGSVVMGGLGFAAGYAVAGQAAPTQPTPPSAPGGGGMPGQMPGQMDGQMESGTGSSGQAPDFDGDGQPDDTATDTSENA